MTGGTSGGRIINGVDAHIEDHPWIAYLEICPSKNSDSCEMCGASILSKKTLLTAKHCVSDPCYGTIHYGDVNKNDGLVFNFDCSKDSILHNTYDLAIIKLPHGNKFSPQFQSLSIPRSEQEKPPPGRIVFVVGWGRTCDENGKECAEQTNHPDILQMVKIKVTTTNCPYTYGNLFCAGGLDDEGLPKDACSGDSGGPMECLDDQELTFECGVVSKGPSPPNCGRSPGGYVNLANTKVIEWLIEYGGAQNSDRISTDAKDRSDTNTTGKVHMSWSLVSLLILRQLWKLLKCLT